MFLFWDFAAMVVLFGYWEIRYQRHGWGRGWHRPRFKHVPHPQEPTYYSELEEWHIGACARNHDVRWAFDLPLPPSVESPEKPPENTPT